MDVQEVVSIVLGGGFIGTVGYIVAGIEKKSEKGDEATNVKMDSLAIRLDQARKDDRDRAASDIERLNRIDEDRRQDVKEIFGIVNQISVILAKYGERLESLKSDRRD